jgi:hypothetical protein
MCAILIGGLVALVAIATAMWRSVRRAEVEASLKQDMLNRGMTVDQIERVIRASAAAPEYGETAGPISDNEYYLVEKLVEEGKSVEDIERIIRAFKGSADSASDKRDFPIDVARR